VEFAYYFHYCRNLKFEDRPDYLTLKSLFFDLLIKEHEGLGQPEFTFEWLEENKDTEENLDRINCNIKSSMNLISHVGTPFSQFDEKNELSALNVMIKNFNFIFRTRINYMKKKTFMKNLVK